MYYIKFFIIIALLTLGSFQPIYSFQTSNQSTEQEAKKLLELRGTEKVEIVKIFRGGSFGIEYIKETFKTASWTFYTNGKFTFTPLYDNPISGTYEKVGNNLEFQGEHISEYSDAISIDGAIMLNKENIVLDAIYATNLNSQRIVRISQLLVKDRLIQKTGQVPRYEKNARTEVKEKAEKAIEGIKIPSEFSISIEGKTDKGAFGPIGGFIYIDEPPSGSKNPLSIHLVADLDLQWTNGWINLSSMEGTKEAKNIQIQAKNGQVRLQVSSSKDMQSAFYTLGIESNVGTVLIENGILTFSVDGDCIFGEIKASGMYLPTSADQYISDFKQSSIYEAKITGEIRKSPIVEKLKASLKSSFNGQWETAVGSFGQIKLQQNGQQVSGTYTGQGGGTIKGIVQGSRLDFTWQNNRQIEEGRGFFRAINSGGTLVGIREQGDSASQKEDNSLIASWQIPSFIAIETFSPFDLSELKSLGQELAIQGRCEQAALLLDKVIKTYLPQERIQTQAFDRFSAEWNSLSALFALNFLIDCHFQLGNYKELLDSLNYGMKIVHFLGPERSASRLFRERTAKIAEELKHNASLCEIMEDGYRNWQHMISGSMGVVGLALEQDETTKEIVVSSVEEGQPADLAGILPQDTIAKIDNQTTHGLDRQQVLDRLRDKAGIPVTITVRRDNQELEFHLTRSKIEISSPRRQAKLVEALTFFADSMKWLRQMSTNNLYKINTLAKRIAQGQQDPVSALLSTPKDIENQIIQLKRETNAVITRGREVFSEQDVALQESELIFSKFNDVQKAAKIDLKDADAREKRMMQLIESDKRLSPIEKDLYRAYYTDVLAMRLSFSLNLEVEKNFIDKIDVKKAFDENRKRSQEMTSAFADKLEIWRTKLVEDFDKIQALDQGQPFFQKAIEFLISLGHEEEALVTSEKSRARAFADLLAGRSDIQEKRLQEDLKKMSVLSPASALPVTLEDIIEIVKQSRSTTVEYFLLDEKIVIWVILPSGKIETKTVSINKEKLEESIGKFTQLVNSEKLSRGDRTDLSVLLHSLYLDLVKPIEDLLPASPDKVITIVPHGPLFLIPFGTLVTHLPGETEKRPKYFIEAHTLVYLPSIAISRYTYKNKSQGVHSGVPTLLALVNPTGDHVSTEQYFDEIAQFYPDSQYNAIFKGKKATREALKGALEKGHPYSVLYFGTHGLAFDDKPKESYLALAGTKLKVPDVLQLDLHTDLVILGACETGIGKITGDGVNGLSRAFTYAGTPSLLISLWSVLEKQTLYQVIAFHENWIKEGYSKAHALREAQLKGLENYPYQPNTWAGFVLFGEWQ